MSRAVARRGVIARYLPPAFAGLGWVFCQLACRDGRKVGCGQVHYGKLNCLCARAGAVDCDTV